MNLKHQLCTFACASLCAHASRIDSDYMRMELESLMLEQTNLQQGISALDDIVAQSDLDTSDAIHGKAHLVSEAVSMMMKENCVLKLADAFSRYGDLSLEEAQKTHSPFIYLRTLDKKSRNESLHSRVWGVGGSLALDKVSTKGRPQLVAGVSKFVNSSVAAVKDMSRNASNVFKQLVLRQKPNEARPTDPEEAKRKAQRREELLFRKLILADKGKYPSLQSALKAKWNVMHRFITDKLGWYKISEDSPFFQNALKVAGNIILAILKLVGHLLSFVANRLFNVFTGADFNLKEFILWFETTFPIFQGLIPPGAHIGEFFESLQRVNDVILHYGFDEDAANQICLEHMSGRLFLGESIEKLPNPQLDAQVATQSASAKLRDCMKSKVVDPKTQAIILKKFKWNEAWKSWNLSFSGETKFKRTREKKEDAFPGGSFSSVKQFHASSSDGGVIVGEIQKRWLRPKQRPLYEDMISFVLQQEETLLFHRLLLPEVRAFFPGVTENTDLMAFQVKTVKDALATVQFPWWYYEDMCKAEFLESDSAVDFAPTIFAARTKELLAARWIRPWYHLTGDSTYRLLTKREKELDKRGLMKKERARCKEVPDGFCPEGTSANWKFQFDIETFSKVTSVMMTIGWVPSKLIALGLAWMVGQAATCAAFPCEMPIQVLPGAVVGLKGLIFPPCRCMISECVYDREERGCVIKPNWDTSNPYYWLPAPGQKCTLKGDDTKPTCETEICDSRDFQGRINDNTFFFGKLGRDRTDMYNCVSTKGNAESQVWTVGQIPDGQGGTVVNSPVERNKIYTLLGQAPRHAGYNYTFVHSEVGMAERKLRLDDGGPSEAGGFAVADTIPASQLDGAMQVTPETVEALLEA